LKMDKMMIGRALRIEERTRRYLQGYGRYKLSISMHSTKECSEHSK